ncbi:hypothetical protein B7Z17_00770 [Candidatus Saccharibacteria bacterium 32-49-10]|nr:MAG: hypothetical protein B7Z17_00770 [Candidatus Saccharibacteria bacterium 32-49-10]
MKVLLVDDNIRMAERIAYHLSRDFAFDSAESAEEALDKVDQSDYAVIVLDLNLPGMSGLECCRELRRRRNNTPIIILTGQNAVQTRVELLDAGADDYLSKPFQISELRARLSALIRRGQTRRHDAQIKCADLEINSTQRLVKRAGQEICLRRKEFDILHYLALNQGRILTREMIINNVWSDKTTSWISTVDVHIKHLRDKIDRPFDKPLLKTVYGVGYKLDAPRS